MRYLFAAIAAGLLWVTFYPLAHAEPAVKSGTVTISVDEYEKLTKATEADEKRRYWEMTFQQILEQEKGDEEDAWELYEYWVLRTIYLNDNVNGSIVGKLITDINVLNAVDSKPITLVISSWGGSVFDGLNLYNAMQSSPSPVYTVCDGMAVSMGAVLLAAGDHRTARDGCIFMIHEVAGGQSGPQTTDKLKTADTIISVENVLLQILSDSSGLSMADVRTLGEFETFWRADEAFRLGFVDEVESSRNPREQRTIPEDLMPKARMARQITERLE